MLLSLRSMVLFSALIAPSVLVEGSVLARPLPRPAEPVVKPDSRLDAAPEDCAVPALLVPGGVALELLSANATDALASKASAAKAEVLVIGQSPFMIQRPGAG
jgi:hypothetical protein